MSPESTVQQLAASILAREITPEVLQTLQEPATAGILKQIEPACAGLLEREWSDQDFEEAAVEYCRLFILNPAVPARAAAWVEGESLEIASRIQFMIDNGFLTLPESFQTLAPDHVAILLLVHTTLAGDDAVQFQKDNLAWLPDFISQLNEKSEHVLYSLTAKLLGVVS